MADNVIDLIGQYEYGLRYRLYEIVNDLVTNNRLATNRPAFVHDLKAVRTMAPILYPGKIGRDAPVRRALPGDLERLHPVGDAEPAGFVHVQRWDPLAARLDGSVLEDERRYSPALQPLRDTMALQVDGQRHEGAARRDDDGRARGRRLLGKGMPSAWA
jgi:hypothetical protein